ncbi:serpin family protein [Paenibacillus sp. ISL-20]|uniref:serpin family protein n=1 Tax=Paenibacillus sp. ISL-20 TaxID=2819163 RepID=UPI001BE6087B|nr:serpin family protein [Paenibacillus sp. ISL-20]MBT2765142.1 serpin family protein [Paenibacillus sp. ISL-20]
MRKIKILTGLCLLIGLTACAPGSEIQSGEPQGIEHKQPKVKELSAQERKEVLTKIDTGMVEAQNDFGLRLHQALSNNPEYPNGNLIISPYSITQALALAYNGTAGGTAAEMSDVLGWKGMSVADINGGNRQLRSLLENGGGVVLNVANSVWHRPGLKLKEAYVEAVKDSYGAEVRETDLKQEEAMNEINQWVNDKTSGMIPSIYNEPPGGVAVLINAIYFNGGWTDEFDPANTVDEEFTLSDGTTQKVPMMKREGRYSYKEGKSWQAIRIPYGDGRMHMLVILPKESSSMDKLHRQLWKDASVWKGDYSYETVQLALPKFKAEQSFELPDALKSLGMVKAFDTAEADFSEMAEQGDGFWIDHVTHRTIVDVSEKGTEAAAVTAVGITESAEPTEPIVMNVDRPFFFAIEDRDTGAWLFMGSVLKP